MAPARLLLGTHIIRPPSLAGATKRENFSLTVVDLYLQPEEGPFLSPKKLILEHKPIICGQQLKTGATEPKLLIGGNAHKDTIPAAVRKSGMEGNPFERMVVWGKDQIIGRFKTTGRGCTPANVPFLERMVVIPSWWVADVKEKAAEAAAKKNLKG